jgi:hypothetical protein
MDVGIAGSDFDNQEAHKSYPLGLPSPQDAAPCCMTIASGKVLPAGSSIPMTISHA